MSPFKHIVRGCGYIEGYGNHPGTAMLIGFIVMGGIAGAGPAGWRGFLVGCALMAAAFGPMYLCGAYGRSRDAAARDRRLAGSIFPHFPVRAEMPVGVAVPRTADNTASNDYLPTSNALLEQLCGKAGRVIPSNPVG